MIINLFEAARELYFDDKLDHEHWSAVRDHYQEWYYEQMDDETSDDVECPF